MVKVKPNCPWFCLVHVKMKPLKWTGKHEVGIGVNRTVHLPVGQGEQLRVARGYKHLGATVVATLRFDPAVGAKGSSSILR